MENVSNSTVPKSITNPNVSAYDALDSSQPFSFLEFIKIVESNFTVDRLQNFYIEYLRTWNRVKNIKESEDNKVIIERYRDFIKDINLKYSTIEEQKFLSQLDFNDPLDLDLAIPFYSRKLIEISNYYNKKREESKYQIIKKKLAGTNNLLEQELKNNILNYLENIEDGEIYYDINNIKDKIDVEISELYDAYPLYFNQKPNELIYDNKDLDYGLDIFLKNNEDIISEVFSGVSTTELELKETNDLLDNKRKLTRKYLGNDFYYLSTGSTVNNFVSGLAIVADKPSLNFLNFDFPTTASTDRKILVSKEEIGFFRPHKTSIINIDGKTLNFSFNLSSLQPDTIYYFPDPSIRGGNGEFITFINDNDYVRKNFTSGKAQILPSSKRNDSKYYGYISKIESSRDKYLDGLSEIGYIQDSKRDIFNNLFGLFKNDGSFTKSITAYSPPPQYYRILNGHTFYDYLYGEGYSFNYSTFNDTKYTSTTRSGLSTYTNGLTSLSADLSYQMVGGFFSNNNFYYTTEYLPKFQTLDGIFLMNGDVKYIDLSSSDLSSFELSGNSYFYYSRLVEAGIHKAEPFQRALLDSKYPTLTANMLENIMPNNISAFMVDGASFNSDYEDLPPILPQLYYDDTVYNTSSFVISSSPTKNLYERYDLDGKLYVRNSYTMEISPLESELNYLSNVLPLSVYNETLSAVKKFEIVSDVLTIQTRNNIIITKLDFQNGSFLTPSKQTYTRHHFGKISNRFKKDNNIYFTTIEGLSSNSVDAVLVKPLIFEFNMDRHDLSIYSDYNITPITVSTTSLSAEPPTLAYNPRKNIFTTTCLLKNASKDFIITEIDFKVSPFEVINITQYNQK